MDRNRVVIILLVAAAVVSSLWFFGGGGAAQPNLLLITLDTTRADRIGCYGYGPAATPALDQLSRSGVTFDQVVANTPLTLPSHATMLTGLLPPEHGLRVNGYGRLPGDIKTLARIAGEGGYQTGAFIAAFVLDKRHGLNDGFDVYDDDLSQAYEVHKEDVLCEYRAGNFVVDAALSWLGKRDDRRFFCWVHLYDPHHPHHAHEELGGTRYAGQASYDAEIAFADLQVSRLMKYLQEERLLSNTLVVAVGDHGESLGEHNEEAHGYMLYETTLRVPMIFSMPGRIPQGPRVGALVSLVDLFPTVLSFLDIRHEVESTGRSLVAALSGHEIESGPAYSETYQPFTSFGWSPLCSLTTPEWKYIRSSSVPRLFDRASDPEELYSLASIESETRGRLEQQLRDFESSLAVGSATAIDLDDEAKKRLEALGYVTDGNEGALPAEGVDFSRYPDIEEVFPALKLRPGMFKLQREGNIAEFERVCREMLEIAEVDRWRLLLGEVLIDAGRLDDGVLEIRKYLAANPEAKDVRFNLAIALEKADRVSEAIAELQELVRLDKEDVDTWGKLGQLLQNQGRIDEALEKFLKALEIKPEGRTHYNLALIYEQKADYEKALDHYAEARALDSEFIDVPQNLGELFVRRGMAEAVQYFQAAVDEAPQDASKRLDLAAAHEKLNDLPKAAEEAQKAIDLAPQDVRGFLLFGTIRGKQDQLDLALDVLRKAAELDPQNVSVLNNLGLVLGRRGDFDGARAQFVKALEIQPTNHIANRNLGDSYFRDQQWEKAAEHYRASILAEPNDAEARRSYGHTLHAQEKYLQAAEQFAEAARINPKDARARALRGGMLEAAGDIAGAVVEYRAALKVGPDQVDVLNNLAWILATHPDDAIRIGPDALAFADRARLMTHSRDAGVLDTLAAALAECSRFDEAVGVAQKAFEQADADREQALVRANDLRSAGKVAEAKEAEDKSAAYEQLAREIQQRQELYRMQQPYRQPRPSAEKK